MYLASTWAVLEFSVGTQVPLEYLASTVEQLEHSGHQVFSDVVLDHCQVAWAAVRPMQQTAAHLLME